MRVRRKKDVCGNQERKRRERMRGAQKKEMGREKEKKKGRKVRKK